MPNISVQFTYLTGIMLPLFRNVRLVGSWDTNGNYSDQWTTKNMDEIIGEDGCPAFSTVVELKDNQTGQWFKWDVLLGTESSSDIPGIMTEVNVSDSQERIRSFKLLQAEDIPQQEKYFLNESRRLGAQKFFRPGKEKPGIRFSVWAPNAQSVEVMMSYVWDEFDPQKKPSTEIDKQAGERAMVSLIRSQICGGYVSDDHAGIHPNWGPFVMTRQEGGLWVTDINDPDLSDFMKFDHAPYMFRVKKDNGKIAYRSDLYSRCQIGYGDYRPEAQYKGKVTFLDGTASCSVVVDPDLVTQEFLEPVWPETKWISQEEFWKDEANFPPRPKKQEDLIIYELHVGALGFGKSNYEPGTLHDAIQLLDYLTELGINAIELLPMSEYGGGVGGWGYSTSHFFAIEYSGGGRDQYKWFIRECHRRGISVIIDVVYNHYSHNAERAQWMYDTDWHDKNVYYWYQGKPWDYPDFDKKVENEGKAFRKGTGGYVDNLSTAWAPRYHEEQIRKMFISSAIALAVEFHVDGFRVDQSTSIHAYNVLHANGQQVSEANKFGEKLLRELNRTLKLVKPDTIIMAEDHSNDSKVTKPAKAGGIGFDAVWYADFYHHLIGDTGRGSDYANLIRTAGSGGDGPLAMDYFAGALSASGFNKVVYNESHDEAGNHDDDKTPVTDRNIRVAMGISPDSTEAIPTGGERRKAGEARCRFAAGVTLLSAGTPMFLFGEEVCAEKKYRYGKVLENREDLYHLKETTGRNHFEYYRQLIDFRKISPGLKSKNIDTIFIHNEDRVLAFRRWNEQEEYLVVCSLNNQPFSSPNYHFESDKIKESVWREVFNSDAEQFGGDNVGNFGADIQAKNGSFSCVIPANSVVAFKRLF